MILSGDDEAAWRRYKVTIIFGSRSGGGIAAGRTGMTFIGALACSEVLVGRLELFRLG